MSNEKKRTVLMRFINADGALSSSDMAELKEEVRRYMKGFSTFVTETGSLSRELEKKGMQLEWDADPWVNGFLAGRNYQASIDATALANAIHASLLELNRPTIALGIGKSSLMALKRIKVLEEKKVTSTEVDKMIEEMQWPLESKVLLKPSQILELPKLIEGLRDLGFEVLVCTDDPTMSKDVLKTASGWLNTTNQEKGGTW